MGKEEPAAADWTPAAWTLARATIDAEERVVDWLAAAEAIHAQALRTLGTAFAATKAVADDRHAFSAAAAATWQDGVAAIDRLAACQRNLAFSAMTMIAALSMGGARALAISFGAAARPWTDS